jgi:hypothetical protein
MAALFVADAQSPGAYARLIVQCGFVTIDQVASGVVRAAMKHTDTWGRFVRVSSESYLPIEK